MATHRDGVLAGHQGVVASVVDSSPCGIAGRIDVVLANYLEVPVDLEPAEVVPLAGNLRGQRAGLDADGPDHGIARDVIAVVQGYATGIDSHHRGASQPLHASNLRGGNNRRLDACTQCRADAGTTVYQQHLHIGVCEDGAQPGGHFGGRFDAGETTAAYHHGITGR
ncbi:hypothetical protein D3C81_1577040 [compost metagenome]